MAGPFSRPSWRGYSFDALAAVYLVLAVLAAVQLVRIYQRERPCGKQRGGPRRFTRQKQLHLLILLSAIGAWRAAACQACSLAEPHKPHTVDPHA